MSFFNWARWLRSLYRPRKQPYRKNSLTSIRLSVEGLEDRTLLSTLPAPLVSNPRSIGAGFGPSLAMDPVNPQKLVEVSNALPPTNSTRSEERRVGKESKDGRR